MRIGFGTTVLAKGLVSGHVDGIGVYTRSLLDELDKLNSENHGINFGCDKSISRRDSLPRHSQICLPLPYQTAIAFSLLTSLSFPGSNQLGSKIDLFHAPDHYIPILGKIPVVATVMDVITHAHPEWVSKRFRALKNNAFQRMVRSAQQIIAPSEFSKADIVHYFGISPDRVSVTPLAANPIYSHPVTLEKRLAVLRLHGLEQGFFIFVGTIQPRKNIARILEAHRMLPIQMQKASPMIIVGRNGWCSDEILSELHFLQARGCGRWLENVPDEELHALLQSARALVYPSLYEGFGLPVLEGFAAGIPVISSNTTSIPEVAKNAAILVNPESSEEIAAAMQRLLEDEAWGAELIERGRKRVMEFNWAACARETLSIYQKL